MSLFDEFKQESEMVLLFLKNIRNIELMVWEKGEEQPKVIFRSLISNNQESLFETRCHVERLLSRDPKAVHSEYRDKFILDVSVCDESEIFRSQQWLVVHSLSGRRFTIATGLTIRQRDSHFENVVKR
jgi:hypothetical protein